MSQSITNAFVQQFNRNIFVLAQQMGSMLRPLVREDRVNAKKAFFDRLGPTTVVAKNSRHADTPLVEQDHTRRSVTLTDYGAADLVDREDKIRMLVNPESEVAQNFVRGMGRQIDSTIVAAFDAAADEGQFGGTSTAFPAGNTIASGGTGLTTAKIIQASRILNSKDVPSDGRVWVISSQTLEDMLNQTEVTSADYNMVKALVQGDVNTFMGFRFVRISDDILPIDGSNDRSTYIFQRDGMGFAIGQEIRTEMDRRPDKWNALQILVTASFGALRIDDDRVLEFLVRES